MHVFCKQSLACFISRGSSVGESILFELFLSLLELVFVTIGENATHA